MGHQAPCSPRRYLAQGQVGSPTVPLLAIFREPGTGVLQETDQTEARREQHLAVSAAALQRLAAQAKVAAEAGRQRTGTQRQSQAAKSVDETTEAKTQTNCTDPERHSMPTRNKGREYYGNAQASGGGACQIILACDVTDAAHDKQQAVPVAHAALTTLA